jgi:hypothetical protein
MVSVVLFFVGWLEPHKAGYGETRRCSVERVPRTIGLIPKTMGFAKGSTQFAVA